MEKLNKRIYLKIKILYFSISSTIDRVSFNAFRDSNFKVEEFQEVKR